MITISGEGALDQSEIEKALRDSERYADEDSRRRRAVELRNESDQTAYEIRRILNENRDKLDENTVRLVEQKIEEVERLKENGDISELESTLQELKTVSQQMGETLYRDQTKDAGQAQAEWNNPPPSPGADDVIDAEYREL